MAATIGDILQVVVDGRSLGEDTTNVYYYEVEAVNVNQDQYDNWLEAFVDTVIAPQIPVMNTDTVFTQYTVKNLTNGLDYAVRSELMTGTLAGVSLPAYLTFSAQLVRSTLVTRNGGKRFSGLVEAGVTGNTINWVPAQKLAFEEGLIADVGDGLTDGIEAKAVIVGRFPQSSPQAGELDLSRINDISAARLGNRVTSQVSRKLPQVY